MNWTLDWDGTRQVFFELSNANHENLLRRTALHCTIAALLTAGAIHAQVVTVDTKTGTVTNNSAATATYDRRYRQIEPTRIPLSKTELDAKTRLELIRLLQSEQGFAMRPFPCGHKGLMLAANGLLDPAGEAYLAMVTKEGISAKPGDRLVLTDIKIEHSKIVFELNGGPDPKHRFLRHVQIGVGPDVTSPVVRDDDQQLVGARLTLNFDGYVPELTGAQVKALLAPLISFDLKTPIQAFTDTLPAQLKEAILNHRVLVGMSTEMVLYAKGQPDKKTREMDGQMPFEEWIYGQPPKDIEFVRINGNRVIRLEVAKTGETPVIYSTDEVSGLMRTDGTPVVTAETNTRTVPVGDVERNPDTQAPAAAPSLRNPGENAADGNQPGVMKPVRFPTAKPDDKTTATPDAPTTAKPDAQTTTQPSPQPGANPDEEPAATPASSQSSPPSNDQK